MPRTTTLLLCLLLALALGQGVSAAAQNGTLVLESPLRCANGQDCFIQNYVDQDPGPGFRDYACGSLGYDGHTGTDIRPLDLKALRNGVEVLAAAAGVVRATRDGMADLGARLTDPKLLAHSGGGNIVVLEHPGGWITAYAHLRKGSIRVIQGQQVTAGQALGLVGLSGATEFPHVELAVRKDGRPVDPFRGLEGGPECGQGSVPLWSPAALTSLAYTPSALAGAGFTSEPPGKDQAPDTARLSVLAPAVIFWVRLLGTRPGDELLLRLTGPDGKVLAEDRQTLDQAQAQRSVYIGKRRRVAPWPLGTYTGICTLSRRGPGGELSVTLSTEQTLDIR